MYIVADSGGFRKGGNISPKGFDYRAISAYRSNGGRLDGKTVHYQSDGTGRDHYITSNAGGFARLSSTNEEGFGSTLRNYEKVRSPMNNNKDYFSWAQVVNRARERVEEKQKSFVIRSTVSRLSPPKTRPDLSLANETSLNKISLSKSRSHLTLNLDNSPTKIRPTLTLITDQTPTSKGKPKFILRTEYTPIKASSKLVLASDYDASAYSRISKTPKMREFRKKIYQQYE
jgi:hypothetical protein